MLLKSLASSPNLGRVEEFADEEFRIFEQIFILFLKKVLQIEAD